MNYFESNNNDNSFEVKTNDTILLKKEDIGNFTKRLSGKNEWGESKVAISYQTFDFEAPEDSLEKQQIYFVNKAHIELSIDIHYPQFYVMDIIFRSYNEPELKMLWGRLQRFKRNIATNMDKNWIFYLNIMEKASITEQTTDRDALFTANIFNPTMFYLTREVPDMLTQDTVNDDGELYGGNVIRMLIPVEFVTFQVTDEIDTSQIKGEVLRENEARDYLNNPENQSTWSE